MPSLMPAATAGQRQHIDDDCRSVRTSASAYQGGYRGGYAPSLGGGSVASSKFTANFVKKTDRTGTDSVNFSGRSKNTLFAPEIMSALRSRGGPMWLRDDPDYDMSNAREVGSLMSKHADANNLHEQMKHLGSLQTDFNALFGFSNCPRAISKTLLDRLTAVLDQVAIHREHDGVDTRTIDWKQFEGAVYTSGLEWVGPANIKSMFHTVDRDNSGFIDFNEWIGVLSGQMATGGGAEEVPENIPALSSAHSKAVAVKAGGSSSSSTSKKAQFIDDDELNLAMALNSTTLKESMKPATETQKIPLSLSQTIKESSLPTPLKTLPSQLPRASSAISGGEAGVGTAVSSGATGAGQRGFKRTASTLSAVSKNINGRAMDLSDIQEEVVEEIAQGA